MQRVGRVGVALVGVLATGALVGWYTGVSELTYLLPGSVSMKPNAALAFIVLAVAVMNLDRRWLVVPLGAATAVLGTATLLEGLMGQSLGIDQLAPGIDLGGQPPRMAPATALCLLILGVAVVTGGLGRTKIMRGLSTASFGVGQVAILGYAYGVSSLFNVGSFTTVALPTSICLVVLSISILFLDPSTGLIGLMRDTGSAGRLLRPFVPFLLIGPSLLGWLRLQGEDRGWFDARFGVEVFVMGMTLMGGALSWRAGVRLHELDRQRNASTRALDETNRSLEATVLERTRELAERQSFTDSLLETIDVGIVSCDADGNYLVRNRAQRDMAGLRAGVETLQPEDAQPYVDMLSPDGGPLSIAEYPLMRALRGEEVESMDLLIGPRGGPHREVVARGSQILDEGGAILGAVALLTDVTTERTASRALDDERRKLTEAQRIGRLGSFEHDFVTGIWSFSDQLCALWGLEPGVLLPGETDGLIFDEDRQAAWDDWSEATRLGGHHTHDYRIRRANDGAERVIRSSIEVQLGPDGRAVHGHGTHQDITEVTKAEKEAGRANTFLNAVLTATPDFTFVTDLETGALIYGSGGKNVLGMTAEDLEALGPEAIASLIHPDDRARLLAVNKAAADLPDGEVLQLRYRAKHVDGQWRWLSRRIAAFRRDHAGVVVEVLGVVRDITEVMDAEERLTHAALHDGLTGLPNRALLVDRLEAALARSGRDGREVGVLFCDLDGFKRVNDTAGHAAGDLLLLEIASRLAGVIREADTVARVGGDEFVIVVEPWNRPGSVDLSGLLESEAVADRALAVQVAERVAEAVRQPVKVRGVDHVVTASIGITYAQLAPGSRAGTVTADQVLQDADAAMYLAKGHGKDRFEVFEYGMRTDLAERGRVERLLRQAIQTSRRGDSTRPRLSAEYQPIFDADTGALVGFEALARLTDAEGQSIAPQVFIDVAEATGIIHQLGRIMLDLACNQLQEWRAQTGGLEKITMAVNISALQAQHASLDDDVRRVLSSHHLVPADLVLELTETALLQAAHSTITTLRTLQAEGVGIAIDDFGVGYASLRYLATLPVTVVKIDRSFTAGLPHDPVSRKIVNAVAGLAADLDLGCVVDGVENESQRAVLPGGVRLQGYLTGRPQPPEAFDVRSFLVAFVP